MKFRIWTPACALEGVPTHFPHTPKAASRRAIIAAGISAIATGVFLMFRVHTISFTRNPYLFSDLTWGLMYVLHGLAGVGLIGLVIVHIYFAIRPEKWHITGSMIYGSMNREFYLEHYDPERWTVETRKVR